MAAFLIPLVGAWLAIRFAAPIFFRPEGSLGLVVWVLQALVVGLTASRLIDIFARRLLPLATLFNMSLVFPDQAPSRFSLALRGGSVTKLKRKTAKPTDVATDSTAQQFAEQAIAMVAHLSKHDRLTRGHSERVRAYADMIAEEMDLPEKDRIRLSWAALLHDIGKTNVPAHILNKDGRPSESEWKTLAKHPGDAEVILAPLAEWLGPWIGAATQHHERWDGDGYPAGIGGNRISLAGRITAVADAYDTMTSTRSYKKAISPQTAREELVACSGTQFDADVVRAFLNVSLGRRWMVGPFAALAELPGIGAAATATLPAIATSAVVVGSIGTGLVAGPTGSVPTDLAFATETSSTSALAVETTSETTATISPSTTANGPVLVIETSSTAPESTTSESTTTESTTASSTSSTVNPSTSSSSLPATTSTTAAPATTTTQPPSTTTTAAPTTTTTEPKTTTTTVPPAELVVYDDDVEAVEGDWTKIWALDNDLDGGSPFNPTTLEIISGPDHARSLRIEGVQFKYRPVNGYTGPDKFQYKICNLDGQCDTGWVIINVVPDN